MTVHADTIAGGGLNAINGRRVAPFQLADCLRGTALVGPRRAAFDQDSRRVFAVAVCGSGGPGSASAHGAAIECGMREGRL